MQLVKTEDKFIFKCTFNDKSIPKSKGFWWDMSNKVWYTQDVDKALGLIEYADDLTHSFIKSVINEKNQQINKSIQTTSDIIIPKPNTGIDYLPYQKAGIEYSIDKKSVIIADEMGLGKTIQQSIEEPIQISIFTDEEKTVIYNQLRYMICEDGDWASEENYRGFNKLDTGFGHSLNDFLNKKGFLTDKQIKGTIKLLLRYPRQIENEETLKKLKEKV